ncbi:carboxylesterase NlhH [Aspergillus lentulus]|uniref:Carboxylesterase NlhH n=1 Tax=Aspergillus lentulus TaxID=293939 RepID=A0AAN4PC78_ASPLE|nr:carboxylesterase NlhH [Aspergillus lentulus]
MADYSEYSIPTEEWIALEKTLPPPPTNLDVHALKDMFNRAREERAANAMVNEGLQSQVTTQDYSVPARDGFPLEARSYRPVGLPASQRLPVYLHLHGGGFAFGTLASEDAICSRVVATLAKENTPVVVVNVNYRHTPEYKYPVPWNDAADAFHWVHDHLTELGGDGDSVLVGGISAGAWMTASLTLAQHLGTDEQLAKRPKIKGQVLMIPALVGPGCYAPQLKYLKDPKLSSYVDSEHAPILPVTRINFFMGLLETKGDETDLMLNPGNATAEQVRGLPPTTFGIAGRDPLRDEGLFFAKLLTDNGVPTDVHVFPGLPHGFRVHATLSKCKRWDSVMAHGVQWALSKPAATGVFEIKTE